MKHVVATFIGFCSGFLVCMEIAMIFSDIK